MSQAELDIHQSRVNIDVKPSLRERRSLLRFPYFFSRNRVELLDAYNLDHIQMIGDDMAEGKVAVANICGVAGFVIDGSNSNAIDRVSQLKRRDIGQFPLIIGASYLTRTRLINHERIPSTWELPQPSVYDLPHFLVLPVRDVPFGIGKEEPNLGRTAPIFWANFYSPMKALEEVLLERNSVGFLSGASANPHNHSSIKTTSEVIALYGNKKGWVDRILVDKKFEKQKPFEGSHIIFKYREDGVVVPLRPGSITARSYAKLYTSLVVPENWDHEETGIGSKDVDVDMVRQKHSYL